MDSKNATRGVDDRSSKDNEFEVYLNSGLPSAHIASMLKSQGKDQKDIDAFMEKYETSKKKIEKLIKRFAVKIEQKYGHLDTPELVKKGMKFAGKHNFTQAEKDAFIRFALKGDTNGQLVAYPGLGYTEMAKFFGLETIPGQNLSLRPTDHATLNEIARLFEMNKQIHAAVRNSIVIYKHCSLDALMGKYDPTKHTGSLFIHPLVVALFLPKIQVLEERMLLSNIGRAVIQRSQAYFQTRDDVNKNLKFMNWNLTASDLLPRELESDFEFIYDVARDPNSLNYFSEESPMSNLLKRFTIQIELWKNVLSLRQGQYYSKNDSFDMNDGIMGLHKVLSTYDWTYFDSPDMYQIHDEGTMLRKLLAVFSFRPTFTQISSFVNRTGLGNSNLGAMSRATFVNTPICNIKLPANFTGAPSQPVALTNSLSQSDWFIENKMLVPKNKTVIHSRKMIFFYVSRRQQTLNFANLDDINFRYVTLPGNMNNVTSINTTDLHFDHNLSIGTDRFQLASVVVVNDLINGKLSTGCSSVVISPPDVPGGTSFKYYYYNPVSATISFVDNSNPAAKSVRKNDPIMPIPGNSSSPLTVGFIQLARKYGTIFIYKL